jgi:hypothetical protein
MVVELGHDPADIEGAGTAAREPADDLVEPRRRPGQLIERLSISRARPSGWAP